MVIDIFLEKRQFLKQTKVSWPDIKGFFFSESAIGFQISKKKYSKKLSWAWNLKFPPITVLCYGREF